MNTITKTLLGLICALLLSSCNGISLNNLISIKMSPQGLVSYYKETLDTSPDIFFEESEVLESYCTILNKPSPLVLLSNGVKLNECLQAHEEAVVYIWAPKCKAAACVPLDLLQAAVDEKGMELFIVAEYYDSKLMSKEYHLERPVLGMDISYYKTNLTHRYLSKFLFDVTGGEIKKLAHRLLYFKEGKYMKSSERIEN